MKHSLLQDHLKMRDGCIEIRIMDEGEGGSLSWAEEVEVEHPSWTWFKDQIVEKESVRQV